MTCVCYRQKLGGEIARLVKKEMARNRVALRNEGGPRKRGPRRRKKKTGGLKFDPMRYVVPVSHRLPRSLLMPDHAR